MTVFASWNRCPEETISPKIMGRLEAAEHKDSLTSTDYTFTIRADFVDGGEAGKKNSIFSAFRLYYCRYAL